MKHRASLLVLLLAASVAGACDTGGSEGSEEDLTAGAKKLIGAYVDHGAGSFRGLVLTSDTVNSNANRFFADVDTGEGEIERVEGTFTGGTKTITLKSVSASSLAQKVLGKYDYKVNGDAFVLSRSGSAHALEKVDSYCAVSSADTDCDAQGIVHLECSGGWACASAECEWSCGGEGGAGGSGSSGGSGGSGGAQPTIDCSKTTILHYEYHNQIVASGLDISKTGDLVHIEHDCCPPTDHPIGEAPLTSEELTELADRIEAAAMGAIHVEDGQPSAFGSPGGTLQVCTSDKKGIVIRDIARNTLGSLDIVTVNEAPEAKQIRDFVQAIVKQDMY